MPKFTENERQNKYRSKGKGLLTRLKNRCSKKTRIGRVISVNLSEDQCNKFVKEPCYYCGLKFEPQLGKLPGVDRIDSNKDYTIDNVVPCCKICNTMKSILSIDEFIAHIVKIYQYKIGI